MYQLFGNGQEAQLYCDSEESGCVGRALEDLRSDIVKISGRKAVVKRTLPGRELPSPVCAEMYGNVTCVVIGTVTNERFADFLRERGIDVSAIEGQWEHYRIQTYGEENPCLIICGSDKRGTMWGIYEFCERFLHIDPLYLWTDAESPPHLRSAEYADIPPHLGSAECHEPERREQLTIGETAITDGPVTYRFRGWFINDEDLLMGWAAHQEGKSSFYENYPPVLEQILETALRLKQNLIIPCSHLDLDDPAQEQIVRMVTERGLYISQHHQEPVGVLQTKVDSRWKEQELGSVPSYAENPGLYEEVWRRSIHQWAQYEDVIWQLGLRGRGDRPLWYQNAGIPDSMEARGRIISSAIHAQAAIVKEEYGEKQFLSSSTLWMEGMGLYKDGHLTVPEDTIVIFADFGPSQMWGEGYDTAGRLETHEYGVYYHVGFYGCGPHLVQGNPPEKIYYNYKQAVEKGDRCYSILNVSNIREFVQGIECVAQITWNIEKFNVNEFLSGWCGKEFGQECAGQAAILYKDYFKCFYEMDHTLIDGQMLFMDGMARRVALKLIQLINGNEFETEDIQNKKLFDFSCGEDFIAYYKNASWEGIEKWKQLCRDAYGVMSGIEKERQPFFINNLIVQAEIMLGLYSWVYDLTLAAEIRIEGKSRALSDQWIREAVIALEKAAADREKAQQGKWQHWYDGDQLINLKQDITLTRCLLSNERLEVNILNSVF